jgi:DMSO/TMAO reductase YedYZ molybdopterin-dependent catalytic subunit
VAKWKGVRLSDVLALAEPLLRGRYVKLTSHGLAQYAYGNKPLEPFYEVIDGSSRTTVRPSSPTR